MLQLVNLAGAMRRFAEPHHFGIHQHRFERHEVSETIPGFDVLYWKSMGLEPSHDGGLILLWIR
jgi:hypothetical protein